MDLARLYYRLSACVFLGSLVGNQTGFAEFGSIDYCSSVGFGAQLRFPGGTTTHVGSGDSNSDGDREARLREGGRR